MKLNCAVSDVMVTANSLGMRSVDKIRWLAANLLIGLAAGASGWNILFRDPTDGRYW
ncbi:MAG: hypothetical protein D6820_18595 [Lentisphaerae bacterium]|nr:MAG: hypothetical protein D6820_18595 [Lentisphaerota bacterium]